MLVVVIGDNFIVPNGEITLGYGSFTYTIEVKVQNGVVIYRYVLPKDMVKEVIRRSANIEPRNGVMKVYLNEIIRQVEEECNK